MSRPAITWLITDTHFNHAAVVKEEFCNRPADHGEIMIKWLRHYLTPQDTLIHLGDVIFDRAYELHTMLAQVECRSKILVRGNHDRKSNNWFLNNGFDFVCTMLVIDNILLSHKPQKHWPTGVTVNIHGHFHNTDHRSKEPEFNEFWDSKRHKLLAMEYTDYKPVKLQQFAMIGD